MHHKDLQFLKYLPIYNNKLAKSSRDSVDIHRLHTYIIYPGNVFECTCTGSDSIIATVDHHQIWRTIEIKYRQDGTMFHYNYSYKISCLISCSLYQYCKNNTSLPTCLFFSVRRQNEINSHTVYKRTSTFVSQ